MPPGFACFARGRVVAVADERLLPALRASGALDPGALDRAPPAPGTRGRTEPRVLTLEGVEGRILVRRVVHGGWLAPLWGGTLAGTARPLAELRTTAALRRAGAPVPRPAFAVAERARGPFVRAALGTFVEEGAVDAAAFLAARPARGRLLAAAAALGGAVRRFHDAGGRHADLHVANLLVREHARGCDAVVVDLDRARAGRPAGAAGRMRELMRLYRSLAKRGLLGAVGARGCARFFTAYTAGDRSLRRALRARLPRERLRVALHAIAYRR